MCNLHISWEGSIVWIWERLHARSLSQASESPQVCATRVFFLSLFSCNFSDKWSPNVHRFLANMPSALKQRVETISAFIRTQTMIGQPLYTPTWTKTLIYEQLRMFLNIHTCLKSQAQSHNMGDMFFFFKKAVVGINDKSCFLLQQWLSHGLQGEYGVRDQQNGFFFLVQTLGVPISRVLYTTISEH